MRLGLLPGHLISGHDCWFVIVDNNEPPGKGDGDARDSTWRLIRLGLPCDHNKPNPLHLN